MSLITRLLVEMRSVSVPADVIEKGQQIQRSCPRLAILFAGMRMQALQINSKGAPQGWVQDGMYRATWAALIQFRLCEAGGARRLHTSMALLRLIIHPSRVTLGELTTRVERWENAYNTYRLSTKEALSDSMQRMFFQAMLP